MDGSPLSCAHVVYYCACNALTSLRTFTRLKPPVWSGSEDAHESDGALRRVYDNVCILLDVDIGGFQQGMQ